jgi:hypothetical protein
LPDVRIPTNFMRAALPLQWPNCQVQSALRIHTWYAIFTAVNGPTLPRCCGHRRSSSLPVPPAVQGTKLSNRKENADQQNGKEHEGMWIIYCSSWQFN